MAEIARSWGTCVGLAEVAGKNDRVTCVRYWAGARDIAGTTDQSLPASSLLELLAAVGDQHGGRMQRLLEVGMVLVDGERVTRGEDRPLADSSVVEILPPYAGG